MYYLALLVGTLLTLVTGVCVSVVASAVADLPSTTLLYSNDPLAVAYVAGRQPVGFALALSDGVLITVTCRD